ncbi:hypothetical protein DL98DRAFT_432495 [Cadophora sp. DSE1049]|nr:hypothetical protein DL98DRAFT_432495 [Cadophora sp. DSE1049]
MAHSSPDSKIVQVVHLARDALYEKEKPYFADLSVPGRSRNNHRLEVRDVRIKDARSIRDDLTIDRQGFCLLDCPTSVVLKLLKRDESAVLEYYEQMEAFVLQHFPEYFKVVVFEHQFRRRDPGYPDDVQSPAEQPARLVHRDFTARGLFLRMGPAFPGQEEYYKDKSMDFINVWRVLEGCNDWPLAFCDYTSIDPEEDGIPNDMLSVTSVGENGLLFASPRQQWYLVPDMTDEEVFLFRNASTDPTKPYAYHTAFDAKMPCDRRRQSIELRMVAFRRGEDE